MAFSWQVDKQIISPFYAVTHDNLHPSRWKRFPHHGVVLTDENYLLIVSLE